MLRVTRLANRPDSCRGRFIAAGGGLVCGVGCGATPSGVVSGVILWGVSKSEKALAKLRESPQNVRYDDLYNICIDYFGIPRQEGSSHATFRMPWPGDPRVNIQKGPNGSAKQYQIKQVLAAIDQLHRMDPKEDA